MTAALAVAAVAVGWLVLALALGVVLGRGVTLADHDARRSRPDPGLLLPRQPGPPLLERTGS